MLIPHIEFNFSTPEINIFLSDGTKKELLSSASSEEFSSIVFCHGIELTVGTIRTDNTTTLSLNPIHTILDPLFACDWISNVESRIWENCDIKWEDGHGTFKWGTVVCYYGIKDSGCAGIYFNFEN